MKRKIFLIIPAAIIGIPVLAVVLLFLFLTIVEYRPKPIEEVPFTSEKGMLLRETPISIMSWNIGLSGLGKDEDFIMDGGKKSLPDSKEVVDEYFSGIIETIGTHTANILFIQEIDI